MNKRQVNPLSGILSGALDGTGFRRIGRSEAWLRTRDETLDVIDLQRSTRDDYYYVNLGIVLKEAPHKENIRRASDCHLNIRLEDLLPFRSREELLQALDMRQPMEETVRDRIITGYMRNYGLPLFERYSTRQTILALARTPRSKRFGEPMVWWDLLAFVGIPKRNAGDPDFDPEWGP